MIDSKWLIPYMATIQWRRIDASTKEDKGAVDGILSGGSIDWDTDTSTKVSASVDADRLLDLGPDWLRCIATFEFLGDAEPERITLGTFLPNQPQLRVDSIGDEASCDLYSTLSILEQGQLPSTLTVPAGANPVAYARDLCVGCGLAVSMEDCSVRLPISRTYGLKSSDGDGSKLNIVNDLLGVAGFAAAGVDAMGTVILKKYVEPDQRPVIDEWIEGPNCRFFPDVTSGLDKRKVANCVKVRYSTQTGCIVGMARNDDPDDEYSVPRVGHEVWQVYDVQEALTTAQANAKAAQYLRMGSPTRKIDCERVWSPADIDSVVAYQYVSKGIVAGRAVINSQSIDLGSPGLPTKVGLVA